VPDYFSPPDAESWAGDPARFSEALGVDPETIARYLVAVDPDGEESLGKAFEDDEFEIDDYWVFTDMWRRMGITYPDVRAYVKTLRLGTTDKLPTGYG